MGEYVKYHSEQIKIGTCEDLYYARYQDFVDNLPHFSYMDGNLQPSKYLKEEHGWRYRFPFPKEDGLGIGRYKDYDAGFHFCVPLEWSFQIEHQDVCASIKCKDGGYNVNNYIKCPNSKEWVKTCSNRYNDAPFEVIRQKQVEGNLWTVIRCSYCESAVRLDRKDAASLCRYIRGYHRPYGLEDSRYLYAREVIKRIIAGYNKTRRTKHGNCQKVTA